MKKINSKGMMQGAIALSIAAFIAKILSAVYRVPFQNMVGNTGFYVYQQVYPIYGIGMTFALTGFPVFVSNVVAEYLESTHLKKLLKQLFVIASLIGVGIFAFLHLGAGMIARWMGDVELLPVVQSVSWMFLLMPFLVITRGYFQGSFRMMPTAISQVVEQVVRVAVILFVASLFGSAISDYYTMGTWAMSSATIAAVFAILVMLYYVLKETKDPLDGLTITPVEMEVPTFGHLFKRFAFEGGTICLLSSILVLFQLVDSFSVYNVLTDQGMLPEVAKDLKGIYDRGQPLVQLGMVVGVGFSSSYMPMLSRAFKKGHDLEFKRLSASLLRMTMTFSVVATMGMIAILPWLNTALFGDAKGQAVLLVYVTSIFFASVIMSLHGIFQSQHQYPKTLLALTAGLAVKAGTNYIFVAMFGTLGASLATALGLCVMMGVMMAFAKEIMTSVLRDGNFMQLLAGIALGMTVIVSVLSYGAWHFAGMQDSRTMAFVFSIVFAFIGIVIFLAGTMKWNLFTKREWVLIPKGKSLLRKFSRKEENDETR